MRRSGGTLLSIKRTGNSEFIRFMWLTTVGRLALFRTCHDHHRPARRRPRRHPEPPVPRPGAHAVAGRLRGRRAPAPAASDLRLRGRRRRGQPVSAGQSRGLRPLRLPAARAGRRLAPPAAGRAVRPPLRIAVRHRTHGHQRAVGLSRRHRAGAGRARTGHSRHPQRHRADRAGRRHPGRARHLVPGLPARRPRAHRRAGGARRPRRLRDPGADGGHPGVGQPREQRAHRLFHPAQAEPAAGLGRPDPAALARRHLPAHAAGPRHAALREFVRHARRAHRVGLGAA